MNRVARITLVIMLVSLACFGCKRSKEAEKPSVQLPPEHAKAVEAVKKSMEESKKSTAATVNGAPITMYDLVSEMNAIGSQYVKPGQAKTPEVDKKVRKDALDRLIYRELAVQEAKRQGMTVPPQGIDQEITKMKSGLKTEDAYRKKLESMGVSEDELKKQIERSLLVDMVTEKEIFQKVHISPELVKKTYEKDKGSFKGHGEMTFEQAKPMIEEKLMTAAVQKREDAWISELKKKAKIEVADKEVQKQIHAIPGAQPEPKRP